MDKWEQDVCDANDLLLDRLIIGRDGQPAGMVDDLELSEPSDGSAPVLTAILCGPTALGPRIGAHIGTWWLAAGRRLRPLGDPYPVRIPFEDVVTLSRREVRVRREAAACGNWRLREWVFEKIVGRIPGGQRAASGGTR